MLGHVIFISNAHDISSCAHDLLSRAHEWIFFLNIACPKCTIVVFNVLRVFVDSGWGGCMWGEREYRK